MNTHLVVKLSSWSKDYIPLIPKYADEVLRILERAQSISIGEEDAWGGKVLLVELEKGA